MKKLKLIGDSILAYMPKSKLNGIEERHAVENAPTSFVRMWYPKYKNNKTDINILCVGINDYFRQFYDEDFPKMTTPEIIQGITEFIAEIKNDKNGKLIVLSLLPIRQTNYWSTYYPIISKEIPIVNASLEKFCTKQNIRYIDTYSHFVDKNGNMREDLSDDGIHPNQENGYAILINLINSELEKINQSEYQNCK